jgi:hypothetical protein
LRESGGIFHQSLSPRGGSHTTDTDLLDGILRTKDGGEMGGDLCGEVYPCASALIVEVYDDAGWVSDGVDEMSGDHFGFGGRSALNHQHDRDEPSHIKGQSSTAGT